MFKNTKPEKEFSGFFSRGISAQLASAHQGSALTAGSHLPPTILHAGPLSPSGIYLLASWPSFIHTNRQQLAVQQITSVAKRPRRLTR